ncbi:MAG: ribonuclease E/G [Pseudomonadota bacterium]
MALDLHIGTVKGARVAALLGDDGLTALAAEPVESPDLTGAVYRARLLRYDATADHCLLDLGSVEAVLPGKPPAENIFPVQIRRVARDGKRSEVTRDVVLAGRFLMAAPGISDVKTSSRVRNGRVQRDRANNLGLTSGWILRRTFAEASDDKVRDDAAHLTDLLGRLDQAGGPGLLIPALPLWCRVVMDEAEPSRLFGAEPILARAEADLTALGLEPVAVNSIVDLDEVIAPVCRSDVELPRGGRITIEPTRALTAIDVDAGGSGREAANQAAVRAIAKQLRLRNIGGIVVIDLVSQKSDWRPIVDRFRDLLADDPARTSIAGGVSPLGLLQMSRERRGYSLAEALAHTDGGS